MKAFDMPLRWIRGHNPFAESLFQTLNVGPQARPPQIVAQANNLRLQLSAGRELRNGQRSLTEQDVTESSTLLREDATRAEELLLVHWPFVEELADGPTEGSPPNDAMRASGPSLSEQVQLPASVPSAKLAWSALVAPPADIVPFPAWHQLGISTFDPLGHEFLEK